MPYKVVKSISDVPLPKEQYSHVSKWCAAIDRINSPLFNKDFLSIAQKIKNKLLMTMSNTYLCHGNLHQENIVRHKSEWLSIDPKGIIGELAFEASAFDLLSNEEMLSDKDYTSTIESRINSLATMLSIEYQRLLFWIFIRTIMSAQWFVEDNCDPTNMTGLENKEKFESAISWQKLLMPLGIPLAEFIRTDINGISAPFSSLLMFRLPGNDLIKT